jgi:hypothetical protein
MRSSVGVAFLLSLVATPAAAQGAASDELIPRKLAEALLASSPYGMAMGSSARPVIQVGNLPATMNPKVTLPPGAKVLGGVDMGEMSTGIVILDGPLTTAAQNFADALLSTGWEVMDQGPRMFFGGDEFIDPPGAQRKVIAGAPETYCGRAGTLMTRYEPEGIQQTRLTLTSMRVNRCAQMREQMLQSRNMGMSSRDVNRPRLVNPPGARNQEMQFCPNYNMGMGGRGAELNSQMTPQDLLTHYAKQMADSGWKVDGTGVTTAWTKADTAGVLTEYQITIRTTVQNPMCRKIESELRARRP